MHRRAGGKDCVVHAATARTRLSGDRRHRRAVSVGPGLVARVHAPRRCQSSLRAQPHSLDLSPGSLCMCDLGFSSSR